MTKLNRNQNTHSINSLDDVKKIHLLAVFHSNRTFSIILTANGHFQSKKMGDESSTILTDESVFSQIKEKSRNAYVKSWEDFKSYLTGHDFEECHPGEEDIISFFNHLRNEKKMASSSIWTIYSYINSVIKRKYGWKL